jgi:hypothetical protein
MSTFTRGLFQTAQTQSAACQTALQTALQTAPQSAGVLPLPGGGREALVGNAALALRRDGLEVVGAVGEDDLVADWDLANRMIAHAAE